jgi:colicin import membrane protein
MNQEIRSRILAAADALYNRNGRTAFPTVDAVRKEAKVNMADATTGMREWRRAQKSQVDAPQVPETVQQLSRQTIGALWQQALEAASESFRTAQAEWEAERAELDSMHKELSEAYDAQTQEMEQLKASLQTANEQTQQLRDSLASAERQADLASQKATEIENRANDLKTELDHAHRENERLRKEIDDARSQATKASAAAAKLQGRIEAMESMSAGRRK